MRAEEADLAGPLRDLALRVVFRALGQPTAGEQHVEAGEHREPDGERERGGPRRVLREVPVHDVRRAEKDPAAQEEPAFDLHAETYFRASEIAGTFCSSPCDSRPHLMSG